MTTLMFVLSGGGEKITQEYCTRERRHIVDLNTGSLDENVVIITREVRGHSKHRGRHNTGKQTNKET